VKAFTGAAFATLCALALSGCIDSEGPILPDAKPVFGEKLKLQFFTLRKGFAQEPEQATFVWNGALYAHVSGGMKDVSGFSLHPFEAGDYILQEAPVRHPRITEYALVHRIADAVYQVIAIDEADADEATRTAHCGKGSKADPSPCRIATRDQLFDFARATAARRKDDGGLVIRLPDGSDRPARRKPRR
jgi:hypothetical protein